MGDQAGAVAILKSHRRLANAVAPFFGSLGGAQPVIPADTPQGARR